MSKSFDVEITETLQMTVRVEASDAEQAEEMVRGGYKNCDYILDAEHFVGAEFYTREVREKSKSHRRQEQER